MVASLAGVVGTKYLLGGALVMVDATTVSSVQVMDSVPLTFVIGTLLGLVTGALAGGFILARAMAILLFVGTVALSVPAMRAGDPVIIMESLGMALSVIYLLARNPIERVEAAQLDEDDSATRYGSTLR